MLWTDKVKKILKKYWKIKELKDKQIEVINELLLGNDVIGLLPTGYGKSMCYLLPPLITKKTIFIISPLISLMEDQKEKLTTMGIPCSAMHSNNINKEFEIIDIMDGEIKIVYMSPEYLIKSDGMDLAKKLIESNKLKFLAIDESHCISGWGHDFRPEYVNIKVFRETFPEIPILAVTATATNDVCQDIIKNLKLRKPQIIKASFDRPNLHLKIMDHPKKEVIVKKRIKKINVDKEKLVKPYMDKYKDDKIIIYVNSRDTTVELSKELNKIRKDCSQAYHAGMSKKQREEIQSKFSSGEIQIIVATIAFGMGIDRIVKCVIIFGAPSSIEEYYQQIGRGGRDGLPCETILFFDYGQVKIAQYYMKNEKIENPQLKKIKEENLKNITDLAFLNTCRRIFILKHFNEKCTFTNCGNCDNCCKPQTPPRIVDEDKNVDDLYKNYEKYMDKK